jgi:hypothetical protein
VSTKLLRMKVKFQWTIAPESGSLLSGAGD